MKSPTIPQLPQQKQLYSSLSPYHAKLVGESFLGRKRPVYECTDVQVCCRIPCSSYSVFNFYVSLVTLHGGGSFLVQVLFQTCAIF